MVASARAWTGHNTLDGDRHAVPLLPEPSRHRHEDVHGRHPELGRPRHHQLHPARRSDAQADRGASSSPTKMWSFFAYPDPDDTIVTDARRHVPRRTTSRSTTLVRAIFNHPAFLSHAAKQGLVRSPTEWVVACMRAVGIDRGGRQPAVVDGRHGPAALRAAERLRLASERLLAHDVTRLGASELGALAHLAERHPRHA